jgi:hypothetical protein
MYERPALEVRCRLLDVVAERVERRIVLDRALLVRDRVGRLIERDRRYMRPRRCPCGNPNRGVSKNVVVDQEIDRTGSQVFAE